MAGISYRNVGKTYVNSRRAAVHDVTLDVEEAAFVVLIGPSGCGKTTLLKMTNRLVEPTSGTIQVNGVDITSTRVTLLRRHMGYVIQQVGLFPHLTVATNVATVPRLLNWPRKRIAERVDELLELAGLEPAQYRDRYPKQLSGGQQQRVGLARALAADPGIMLMDEPFGAIDAITRSRLQDQLIEIQRRVRKTVLFVTHDVDEALKLADKLVIMEDGHVVQYDTPFKVLTQPSTPFVRQLLNTDDVLRKLGLITIRNAMTSLDHADGKPTIPAGQDLRRALSRMIADGVTQLVAVETDGKPVGIVSMETINRLGFRDDMEIREPVLAAAT